MHPYVLRIQHFSINDGPGIRTTVFLKGCPLKCLWCHNPESWNPLPELSFSSQRCISCGKCFEICPQYCHVLQNNAHTIQRERCNRCNKCVSECAGALEWLGKKLTPSEVFSEVIKDLPFYRSTKGGLTISGGEPLLFPEFSSELLRLAHDHNLHTAVETSGHARWECFKQIIPYTSLFLYDIKETDSERHKLYTSVNNSLIIENLRRLDQTGIPIHLRCPIIPEYNDRIDHLSAIANLANELSNVKQIDVEPYHPMGKTKAEQIGHTNAINHIGFVDQTIWNSWIEKIQEQTNIPVCHA